MARHLQCRMTHETVAWLAGMITMSHVAQERDNDISTPKMHHSGRGV